MAVHGTATLDSNVNSVFAEWNLVIEGCPEGERQKVEVSARLVKADDVTGGYMSPANPPEVSGKGDPKLVLEATAGSNGILSVHHKNEYHFLPPAQSFIFQLEARGEVLKMGSVRTLSSGRAVHPRIAAQLPAEMWPTYIGEEHKLGEWLADCPEEMLWALEPDYHLMRSLWLNACFTLPSLRSPITQCPNPLSRYCLELRKDQPWLRSKKVRRHKNDFRLTVNRDYCETFKQCERTHTLSGKGTWITPQLIDCLDRCRQERGQVKVYSIELWEKDSGRLAAAIMAFSVGDIFHDYTTATMFRDSRSAGAILTKVVGSLLTEAGYSLWYWGYKNPYMAEYDGQYGGLLLENKAFWARWQKALTASEAEKSCDLCCQVPPEGLDLEKL